jgi:chloramphenicol 3-O phosphotransferase
VKPTPSGTIVVLNGPPRSGKSSIVRAIQDTFEGVWMNLGVDVFNLHVTPPRFRPGMGLRPDSGRTDLEEWVPRFFSAFYDSVVAHSCNGLNVVVDVGHHDAYSSSLATLEVAARKLQELPAYLIGIHCPIEVIMQRRDSPGGDRQGTYETTGPDGQIPRAVLRWQDAVHDPGIYDLEIDTSTASPQRAASMIAARLAGPPPSAFRTLANTN